MTRELNTREYEWKVLRYLNSREEKRVFKTLNSIEIIDNEYYRVEVGYTDIFISGEFDDTGIYFINKEEID